MITGLSDPQVQRYLGASERELSQDEDRFENFLRRPDVRAFAIEAGGEYVGDATIEDIRTDDSIAELRLRLLDPGQWGMGIGRAATEQLLEIARKMGLERVWAAAHPDNDRAIKLLQSLGFERDGQYDSGDTGYDVGFTVKLQETAKV